MAPSIWMDLRLPAALQMCLAATCSFNQIFASRMQEQEPNSGLHLLLMQRIHSALQLAPGGQLLCWILHVLLSLWGF